MLASGIYCKRKKPPDTEIAANLQAQAANLQT